MRNLMKMISNVRFARQAAPLSPDITQVIQRRQRLISTISPIAFTRVGALCAWSHMVRNIHMIDARERRQ